jgi:NAD(P)-dependent dehydrogenase (short-subunit alcohol dehydrogenase family)
MALPSERLDGRHALVTGGGRGLGRASALALAEAGASVTLLARSADELASVQSEITALGSDAAVQPADVTKEDELEAAVAAAEARAPIDILVAAAGLNRTGPSATYASADWDLLMDVNLRGTFLACRAVGSAMLDRQGSGRIVTMSSQMGTVGYPGRTAYCASKHAVNGLTKALAVEWAPRGIAVNAVAPTFVDTPMTRPMFEVPEFAADVERRIPGGRIATTDDVAAAVLYLAGDRARSVTGHILAVDAGWTAW